MHTDVASVEIDAGIELSEQCGLTTIKHEFTYVQAVTGYMNKNGANAYIYSMAIFLKAMNKDSTAFMVYLKLKDS